jgi:hypothetical protein
MNDKEQLSDPHPEDETIPAGPFSVGPVDALVYSQNEDLPPELRPAAQAIPVPSRTPTAPRVLPKAPDRSPQSAWTPGALDGTTPDMPQDQISDATQDAPATINRFGALIMLVPILVIVGIIWYAASHLVP